MIRYLDFKDARCKDCYKCLRECPVKAIKVVDHHAKIIESRCILCGHCTKVCPQNAKSVHTERAEVEQLLKGGNVVASVAPSFVSSFDLQDFNVMKLALGRLGFADAEETSIGAREVTAQYKKLLEGGKYKNFITSCCPAVNTMIELYYPKALQYLAPVDTPMIAHAKMIRKKHPKAKVVFIGPCIAKKREARESGVVDGVLTFEDLAAMFEDKGIVLSEIARLPSHAEGGANRAKYYPISRGIIKSFEHYIDGYEFVAVDGAEKCKEVLENIESLSGMFIEMNSCDSACVNGPCSLALKAGALKANADIRNYAPKRSAELSSAPAAPAEHAAKTPSAPEMPAPPDAEQLQAELDKALASAEDYKRKWYSVSAEYENYRKRTASTRSQAYTEGRSDVVVKLFPIADNLERALASCADDKTKQGIAMVVKNFEQLLADEHITAIAPVGEPFDAGRCEAILAVDPKEGEESGIVKEVYAKGYEQNGKVLRFAQVLVTK